MNFREMSYITAIAKYQNITKAAEALHISQPGLSKFLSNLENELGLKLFDRADKKYIPTYAGQRYLEYSHKITDMKSSLDAELSDIIKRNIGVLNIGLPNMRCAFMLPKTLPVFSRKYPNVKVNIFEGTSAVIDVKLLEGDIDLAFYSKPHELNSATINMYNLIQSLYNLYCGILAICLPVSSNPILQNATFVWCSSPQA